MNIRKKIRTVARWMIIHLSVACIITVGWQGLELLFYGRVQYRVVDDIIALLLYTSIMCNIVLGQKLGKMIGGKNVKTNI